MKKPYFLAGIGCVVLFLTTIIAINNYTHQRFIDRTIAEFPEQLRQLPFSKKAIHTIKIKDDTIKIEGRMHRERGVYNVVAEHFKKIDMQEWTYRFVISDFAYGDGTFTLLFTRENDDSNQVKTNTND